MDGCSCFPTVSYVRLLQFSWGKFQQSDQQQSAVNVAFNFSYSSWEYDHFPANVDFFWIVSVTVSVVQRVCICAQLRYLDGLNCFATFSALFFIFFREAFLSFFLSFKKKLLLFASFHPRRSPWVFPPRMGKKSRRVRRYRCHGESLTLRSTVRSS